MADTLLTEIDGPVGLITLNRPERRNAFDDALITELHQAMRNMEANSAVRVVVLAGAGENFCAGADLNWMKRTAHYTEAENFADARRLAELLATIDRLGKPTIARVHGAVYGGGTGLVAACDMAVAANDASFSFSEARLGLLPATISPYVLRAIGPRLARRYFLTGERFSAGEAYRMQLVSEVCPDDELDDTIHDILQAILACGPQAQVACKKLVADIAGRPIDDLLSDDTARRIAALRASDEGKEGITAFLGKRKPIWAA